MSSTRHAAPGIPFRQERFASSEAYRTSLNALLVAKRCTALRHDQGLQELIWLIQEQSLADPFNVGNRAGSIDKVAEDLLALVGYKVPTVQVFVEDLDNGTDSWVESTGEEQKIAGQVVADLVRALSELALDPRAPATTMPGLGKAWRDVLTAYHAQIKQTAKQSVAATSALKSVVDALRFTRETGMPTLTMGVSRLGKSAGAKTFCAASGGLVRYVLTPEDNDMGSLYRAAAKAIGSADSPGMKAEDVRERVERTIHSSRLMLVFDEAHNLFSGGRRVVKPPQRVLWIRRLIDGGVPVAFVALRDFESRIERYVEQLDWDAAQITDLIARKVKLPDELSPSDFELLVARLAGDFPASSKTLIASAAKGQRGAQYVTDVVRSARHTATKANRAIPNEDDVATAIGARPQFQNESTPVRKATTVRPDTPTTTMPRPTMPNIPPSVSSRSASVAVPVVAQ
jgi:hypothetical protein